VTGGRPTDQVMWPVPPQLGESLFSWVARTARRNVHPSPYTVLRRCGLLYESRPYTALDGGVDLVSLARALGTTVSEVESRVFAPSAAPGFVMLDGVEVRRDNLVTGVRRFSPKSVGACPAHTNQMMYRALPFCAESWQYLQDTCSTCGYRQRWRHAWALDRCDSCSTLLSKSQATTVPRSLRSALQALTRIVSPDRALRAEAIEVLPPRLRELGPGGVLDLAYSLAMVCEPSLPLDRPAHLDLRDQRLLAAGLAHAWEIMLGWPFSFEDLVRTTVAFAQSETEPGVSKQRRTARGRLVNLLQSRDRATKLPQIVHLMQETAETYRLTSSSLEECNVLIKPAARRLGVTEGEVSRARHAGLLTTRIGISNGRLLLNLDAAEIKRLESARRARVGAHVAGNKLRLPAYAIERLSDNGLLIADNHPWLVARFGAPVIADVAIRDLQDRLVGKARPPRGVPGKVDLATVMRGFGGGPKPWETIFDMLITGQLRFCLTSTQVDTSTICIAARDVERCRSLQPGAPRSTFSQADALEILNLSPKHGAALANLRTSTIDSQSWEIDGMKLMRAAARHISYPELVSRTGLYSRTIRDSLLGLGCHPPTELGWIRRSVMSKLRHLPSPV
jgi:hypothetical protein